MRYGSTMVTPMTPVVKKLLILNVTIWLLLIVILQKWTLPGLFDVMGLIPYKVFTEFHVWQPFTYMFLHSQQMFHIIFNMLLLWWLGAELESRWGGRFFLIYYLVCGIGAGIIYTVGMVIYYILTGNFAPLGVPVVGASGAVFGLMLAYGMIFGERVMYFMMLFPMKAKYLVMILGAIEVVTLINSGVRNEVANLAHLGGLISGFLFLMFWTKFRYRFTNMGSKKKSGRKLKLVVDNEKKESPKYWN